MRIGELAGSCAVNPKTIRYYEAIGILPKPARTASGHRIYGEEDVPRLQLIRRLKKAGLPLTAIQEILPAVDGRRCDHARARIRDAIATQLADVERHLRELQTLRAALRQQVEAMKRTGLRPSAAVTECSCLSPSESDQCILPAPAPVTRPRGRKS